MKPNTGLCLYIYTHTRIEVSVSRVYMGGGAWWNCARTYVDGWRRLSVDGCLFFEMCVSFYLCLPFSSSPDTVVLARFVYSRRTPRGTIETRKPFIQFCQIFDRVPGGGEGGGRGGKRFRLFILLFILTCGTDKVDDSFVRVREYSYIYICMYILVYIYFFTHTGYLYCV